MLKAAPHHRDAAYNLEYVARLQNQIAGARAVALTRGGRQGRKPFKPQALQALQALERV
ncbi:MAG: hypothetical protein IT566_03130 [Rhodospirillaceae bacterium]|nr:hypothetical protein [Rhodospirillaceae bacterium]